MESLIPDLLVQLLSYLPREDCFSLKQCSQTLHSHLSTWRTFYFSLLTPSQRKDKYSYEAFVSLLQEGKDLLAVKGLLSLHPQWLEGRALSYVQEVGMFEYLLLKGSDPEISFPFPVEEGNNRNGNGECYYPLYYEYPNYYSSPEVVNYEAPISTTVIHLMVYNAKYSLIHSLLWYHRTQRSLDLNLPDITGHTPLDILDDSEELRGLGLLELPLYLAGARRYNYDDVNCEISEAKPYSPILRCYLSDSAYPEFTLEAKISSKWIRVTKFKQTCLADYYVVRGLIIASIAILYPVCITRMGGVLPSNVLRITHTKNLDYDGSKSPFMEVLLAYNLMTISYEAGDGQGIVTLRTDEVDDKTWRSRALPVLIPIGNNIYIHCTKEDEAAYREGIARAQILL